MLLIACDNFNMEMVDYLLDLQGVHVSACTADGKTGLHLAAIHDYSELARKLIECGINLMAQDEKVRVLLIRRRGNTLHLPLFSIIESVYSISRDEPDSPLMQYITNAGISRAR